MNATRLTAWACLVAVVLCGSPSLQAAGAPDSSPPSPDFKVVGDQAIDQRGFTCWQIDSPYDVYRAQAESVHQQLLSLDIPHDYDNDKQHKHGWNSGWLEAAVGILLK